MLKLDRRTLAQQVADEPVERAAALEQVAHITRGRLEKILES